MKKGRMGCIPRIREKVHRNLNCLAPSGIETSETNTGRFWRERILKGFHIR
jgi:hypothetical protein